MRKHHKHASPAQPGSPGTVTASKPTVAAGGTGQTARTVSADDVRLCAYRKWERAGKPTGDGVRFWLEAEQELAHGN